MCRKSYTPEDRERILKDWFKSGLPVDDYQASNGLGPRTLCRWITIFGIQERALDLLKEIQFDFSITEKTVFIPFSKQGRVPAAALELRDKYHYSLQLIID